MQKITKKVSLSLMLLAISGFITIACAEEIKFAMSPRYSNTVCFDMMNPLLKYLSEKVGKTFVQVFPKSYNEHVDSCKSGEVQVSYSNPIDYIKIAPKSGARASGFKPLVSAVLPPPEGSEYWGLIIVRADSGITSVLDLKGKKGLYVAPSAVGGYLAQVAALKDKGVDVKKDFTMEETPGQKQDKTVMAVYNREADFGFVRNEALEIMKDRIDLSQIKIIFETPKIPQWLISVGPNVDADTAAKIKNALTELSTADGAQMEILKAAKVHSWKAVVDSDFDSVRVLADKTGTAW